MNVLDVLRGAEGDLVPVACLEEGASPCTRADACRTLPLWEGLNRVVSEYLSGFTVQDLARDLMAHFAHPSVNGLPVRYVSAPALKPCR